MKEFNLEEAEKMKVYVDYEKKYKEALELATKAKNNASLSNGTLRILDIIFPELKESEDEKIRKALIRYHQSTIDIDGIKGEKIIVWLEKQVKQKIWSVEDTFNVQRICKYLDESKKYYADITEIRECMDWLKALKERIGG